MLRNSFFVTDAPTMFRMLGSVPAVLVSIAMLVLSLIAWFVSKMRSGRNRTKRGYFPEGFGWCPIHGIVGKAHRCHGGNNGEES